jgi:hypothetical protein
MYLLHNTIQTLDSEVVLMPVGNVYKPPEGSEVGYGVTAEGRKNDSGKPRLDLIAPELLTEVGKILAFGAEKYEARNWEKGMAWGRPFGACMRHLWAWWGGEDTDPESGFSHLAHAACNIMFLISYNKHGIGKDDRFS